MKIQIAIAINATPTHCGKCIRYADPFGMDRNYECFEFPGKYLDTDDDGHPLRCARCLRSQIVRTVKP